MNITFAVSGYWAQALNKTYQMTNVYWN